MQGGYHIKKIFLSFNSKYFEPLLFGMKKYEYRKRFCNEKVKAFLYLSGKERIVIGILELDTPIKLDQIRDKYLNDFVVLQRIDEYLKDKNINAVPIISLTLFKKPITLEMIRNAFPGFMPPQMYYLLENKPQLQNYLESYELGETIFVHDHTNIFTANLAVSINEMKATSEFKELKEKYYKSLV